MKNKRKSTYRYTEGEKNINRAFIMQKMEQENIKRDVKNISNSINKLDSDLAYTKNKIANLSNKVQKLKDEVFAVAQANGIDISEHLKEFPSTLIDNMTENEPLFSDEKISKSDIPSWENVMDKTNRMVPNEVIFEDLLSSEEMQYCIDDINRINDEFGKKTKLNKTDIKFLLFATAMQTARWILIQFIMGDLGETINKKERISDKEPDKIKKKELNDWNQKHSDEDNISSGKGYPTWKDIIFGQYKRIDGFGKSSGNCPYDAQNNGPAGFDDGGRGNHRANTLGHDPILGWIFGTANIMTCTISLSKRFGFATHRVTYPNACFGERIPMALMFKEVYESICEDRFRLAAGLFAQYAHLKSDIFTPNGLPVPLIEAFTKDLAGKLYTEQYDSLCLLKDMKKVGTQAALAILINMTIGFVHGLFYDPKKDGQRDHYEIRTRKILLYSNAISTSLNLAYIGANAYFGNATEAWKKLDLGGLLVSIYRMFSDIRFITRVKEQFIKEEMDKTTKESLAELESMFK